MYMYMYVYVPHVQLCGLGNAHSDVIAYAARVRVELAKLLPIGVMEMELERRLRLLCESLEPQEADTALDTLIRIVK